MTSLHGMTKGCSSPLSPPPGYAPVLGQAQRLVKDESLCISESVPSTHHQTCFEEHIAQAREDVVEMKRKSKRFDENMSDLVTGRDWLRKSTETHGRRLALSGQSSPKSRQEFSTAAGPPMHLDTRKCKQLSEKEPDFTL